VKADVMLEDGLLDLLIKYYNRAYVDYRPQLDSSSNEDYVAITGKVTKHGRFAHRSGIFWICIIQETRKSSYVLAHFIDPHGSVIDTYPDQVQFCFEHKIHLRDGLLTHHLAFVKRRPARTTADGRFLFF